MKKIIVAMPTGFFSLLATLFLVYLSLAANPLDVQSVKLFPHADKCAHFLMYFGCTTVYLFEYAKRKLPHQSERGARHHHICCSDGHPLRNSATHTHQLTRI